MFVYIHDKKNLENRWIKYHFNTHGYQIETGFFHFDFLFGQIGTEKLQNLLIKIIRLNRLYIFRKLDRSMNRMSN